MARVTLAMFVLPSTVTKSCLGMFIVSITISFLLFISAAKIMILSETDKKRAENLRTEVNLHSDSPEIADGSVEFGSEDIDEPKARALAKTDGQ